MSWWFKTFILKSFLEKKVCALMLRLRGISVKWKNETKSVNRTQAFYRRWQRHCEAHWSSASMQCHWYPVGLLSCDLFSISCFWRYRRPGLPIWEFGSLRQYYYFHTFWGQRCHWRHWLQSNDACVWHRCFTFLHFFLFFQLLCIWSYVYWPLSLYVCYYQVKDKKPMWDNRRTKMLTLV